MEQKNQNILLVDDHGDTGKVFQMLLERQGYKVKIAYNVKGAIEAVTQDHYDLLISDIGLPDGSGLDLMRTIRETQQIKGIALSGFGMDEDVQRSKEAGFAEHLTKPVNFQKLKSAVEQLLS